MLWFVKIKQLEYNIKMIFNIFKKNVINITLHNNLYAEVLLKKEKNVKYEPGQFLIFNLKINGVKVKRAYSISNDPKKDNYLRFIIKKVENGLVSNYIFDNFEKIKNIDISNPLGNFTFNNNFNNHIFIAGGSGITPIASIINSYIETNNNFTLIYGNKNKNEIILDEELKLLSEKYSNLKIISLTSDGSYNDKGIISKKGNLDVDIIKNEIKNNVFNEKYCFYVCGPEIVIENCTHIFNLFQIKKENIKIEKFINFQNDSKMIQNFKLTVLDNGKEKQITVNSKETILDSLIKNNFDINYSCTVGVCKNCAIEINGDVESTSEIEIINGNKKILACCSYPISNIIIKKKDG